ncbi:MAG: dephospho-CoA kinase [Oscillatoria sp. SIO1A7]|nr:dephospho-CoA kinase [Oscillatoria sp. SIO1A7]
MQRIIGLTGGIATGKTTVSNYLKSNYNLPVFDADVYAREAVEVGSPILDAIASRYGSSILARDRSLNRRKLGEIIFNSPSDRQWLEQQIHPYVRQRFSEAIEKTNTEAIAARNGGDPPKPPLKTPSASLPPLAKACPERSRRGGVWGGSSATTFDHTEAIAARNGGDRGLVSEEQNWPEGQHTQGQSQSIALPTLVLVIPLLFEANLTHLPTEIWVAYCPRQLQLERLMARNNLSLEQARSRIDSQMDIEEKAARADVVLDNSSTREGLLEQVDESFEFLA